MIGRFLSWADRRNFISVRSATLYITVWMTWRITVWAFEYARMALEANASGIDTAAVLGAVTVPFAALQAAAFKIYMESK